MKKIVTYLVLLSQLVGVAGMADSGAARDPLPAGVSRVCMSGICRDIGGSDNFGNGTVGRNSADNPFDSSYLASDNPFLNRAFANERFRPAHPDNARYLSELRKSFELERSLGDSGAKVVAQQRLLLELLDRLSENRLDGSEFSKKTPYPREADKDALDREFIGAEAATEAGSPLAVAEAVTLIQERARLLRSTGAAEKANYLERELLRMFINSKGLLKNLRYAKPETLTVQTKAFSQEGKLVREVMNETLGVEEELGFLYHEVVGRDFAAPSVRESYDNAISRAGNIKSALLIADGLYARGFPELALPIVNETRQELTQFKDALALAKSFASAFAKDSAVSLGAMAGLGLVAAFSPALATGVAVGMSGYAIYQAYAYLSEHEIGEEYARLVEGYKSSTAEERAALAGIAASQVAVFLGTGGSGNIFSSVARKAASETLSSAAAVGMVASALKSGTLSAAEGETLSLFARNLPQLAERLVEQGVDSNAVRAVARELGTEVVRSLQALQKEGAGGLVADLAFRAPKQLKELAQLIEGSKYDLAGHLSRASRVVLQAGDTRYYTPDELVKVAKIYKALSEKDFEAAVSSFSPVKVTRGILKVVELGDGQIINQSKEDVFRVHAGIIGASNRMDPPGRITVSTAYGEGVKEAIGFEIGNSINLIAFSERVVTFDRVLDLRLAGHGRSVLGLESEALGLNFASDRTAYMVTNAITDLAILNDVEAIILPSTKLSTVTNIYYFP